MHLRSERAPRHQEADEAIRLIFANEEAYFALDCSRPGDDDECPVAEVPVNYSDIQEPNYFEDRFGQFIDARVCDVLGKPEEFLHP